MKWLVIVSLVAVTVLSWATSATALEWTTLSRVSANRKMDAEGEYTWARGVHQVVITKISVAEELLPIFIRVYRGELRFDGVAFDACSTGWKRRYSVECRINLTQHPCQNGTWDAYTVGRLTGHPYGGTKVRLSSPRVVNCEGC